MARSHHRSGSLAYGILRVTLTVGAITVAAAILVTMVESYRLTATQAEERMGAYLEVMRSEALSGISHAVGTVENAAESVTEVPTGKSVDRVLASRYVAAHDVFDQMLLLKPDGTLQAAYPRLKSAPPTSALELARDVDAAGTQLRFASAQTTESPSLWGARRLRLSGGESRILVVRLKTGFLSTVAGRVASRADRRSALVVDAGRPVASGAEGPMLRMPTAVYGELSNEGVGQARVRAPSVGMMRGLWAPVESPSGPEWRVLVAEPSGATIATSLLASLPTLLVLVVGGMVALAITWVVARRLVLPLREIETAGLEAARGAHVVPLGSDRDDEVGRLAEAFNAVGLRLNALHDVSRLLAGASRLDQVLDAIIEAVGHLVGPGMVAIYLLDSTQQTFHLASASGGFDPPEGPLLRARSGPFLEALQHDQARALDPRDLPMQGWEIDAPCRALVAPLAAGGEHLGVMVVLQHGRSEYTDAEVEMLRTFASQAAIGLIKSRLFEREIESRRVAESLREIAEELVRPVSFADALDAVAVVVSRGLGDRQVLFALEDRESLGLPVSDEGELERELLAVAAEVLEGVEGARTLGRGVSPAVDGLLERFGAAHLLLARIEPATPFRGVFVALSAEPGFEPRSIEIVEGMVKIVTLALDNAYFFERSRVRARNLETIFRIAQAVGSSLELKVVLNRVLDVVQMIFAADAVSLMTFDPARRVVTTAMARGAISSEILHLEVEVGEDLPGRVFSTREPIMLADVRSSDAPLATEADELGLRSLLAVPLLARGSAVGVLTAFSANLSAFDEEDVGLLQTFAFQAALAIDTARLYSHEHQVAATLQRSILPEEMPAFEEIETATAYKPAGSDAGIGGDYYDLFRSPRGHIVIAVADVCGKGVEAATKTSMLKYSIRALVAAGFGPAACLDEVNRMVAAKNDPSDILSVWLGFLDVAGGRLVWANGGHPPALLLRSGSREIARLSPSGPILGATSRISFEEETIEVGAGDTLLLYTDGVTEARDGGKFFGEGRVRRALRYGGSAQDVVERLLGALKRFNEGDLRDDVAVVAVRVKEDATATTRTPTG